MNKVMVKGILKDIQPSHTIDDITFDKAKLICKRDNGKEDVINLRFKSFSNKYKENDEVSIIGNLRSYSYKIDEERNKVLIYVFTYFDEFEEDINNKVEIDGRICKINELRTTKDGKHNVHFILANNLILDNSNKRLNSYIPCLAWGKLAKDISKLSVNTKLKINGQIHSREHKKVYENGEIELRVAHELVVSDYEVIE